MQILCDTHTHTIFSRHAYSTIEECVRAAAERGLERKAVADDACREHSGFVGVQDHDCTSGIESGIRD